MKYVFILLLIGAFNTNFCVGQNLLQKSPIEKSMLPAEIGEFENHLQKMIEKVKPASVLIITREVIGNIRGMMASGVVVSAGGIIMTAGHLVLPGGKYSIVFPDGKKAEATGLGKIDGLIDAGLLKINEDGDFPYAEMGYSSTLKVGEPCFSLAYPGSFPEKMAIRFGYVAELNKTLNGKIRTTCIMEPGDSGGPVFDLEGRVIGIRSYIGLPLDENYDVPVDVYRRYWEALQKPVTYSQVPVEVAEFSPDENRDLPVLMMPGIAKSIQMLEAKLQNYSIVITSTGNNSSKTILGALINLDGLTSDKKLLKHSYVVSKSSEVRNAPRVTIGNKIKNATVIFRDEKTDLVLLQLDTKNKLALHVNDIESETLNSQQLGKLLISPSPINDGEMSILGNTGIPLLGVYNVGYLGMRLERKDGMNTVTSVQPNTAASKAKLELGDVILDINRIKITDPSIFIRELNKTKPRDEISIVRLRNDKQDTLSIVLQIRPFHGIDHLAEEFTDGRSERRDDFENVFIHDAKLKPSECGGPVFDLDNKLIGINIARYSRTSSLAIPGKEVVEFLKAAIN